MDDWRESATDARGPIAIGICIILAVFAVKACVSGIFADGARRTAEEAASAATYQADAIRSDNESQRGVAAAAEAKRNAAAAELQRRVEMYSAMKPWQRMAEVAKLCPPTAMEAHRTVEQIISDEQPCDDEDGVSALMASASSTPEEKALRAAIGVAKKQRSQMHETLTKSAKCCDGTLSDSCMCNSVHQGCCSHHGGVCGCE